MQQTIAVFGANEVKAALRQLGDDAPHAGPHAPLDAVAATTVNDVTCTNAGGW